MKKTLYVSTKLVSPRMKVMLGQCPSAGPYPNITGMRNLYWGKDALIIKSGAYAYKVSPQLFSYFEDLVARGKY